MSDGVRIGRYERIHDKTEAMLKLAAWARKHLAMHSQSGEPEVEELPESDDKLRLLIRFPDGSHSKNRITLREDDINFKPEWAEQQVEEFIKGLP